MFLLVNAFEKDSSVLNMIPPSGCISRQGGLIPHINLMTSTLIPHVHTTLWKKSQHAACYLKWKVTKCDWLGGRNYSRNQWVKVDVIHTFYFGQAVI